MVTTAPAFTAWLDAFFAAYYRRRPVNATFIGVHDYDDRLPDLSIVGIEETIVEMDGLLNRLRALPPEVLSPAEALDRRLAEGFLEIQQWEFTSGHFHRHNPSFYTGEAIFGVVSLFLRPFAPFSQRARAAVARLEAIPTLLRQGQTNLRTAPALWIDRAVAECRAATAHLFASGLDLLIQEQGIDGTRLRRAATVACDAFNAFERYLSDDLRRRQTATYACGPEAFALLLRQGHCLEHDAAAIERYALEQGDRAVAALHERAAALGAASWTEALARLADDHPPADGYYARFEQVWGAARAAAEEAPLVTWPDYPITYVPQPLWAQEAAPSLYFLPYRAPAPFDDLRPVEYLVPPLAERDAEAQERQLRATNTSVIKLNHVIHHGGLGHHVQNYHAYRAASRIGQIAGVDCASRIALFCGGTMAEGWACYATDLMDEIGFLTPLESYAELHTRLRMAARAVVDVRLHHGTFTLDQAAAYYQERVGMTPAAAQGEAVKNSMFPGAAIMYLMGTDQIHELRRDLAARQGAAFTLRHFHDRFLSFGSVPVALICAAMREESDA